MTRIFISHSSGPDDGTAVLFADRLRAEGFASVFLSVDPRGGIQPGRRWEQELYAEISRCDLAIFLSTSDSNGSRWCFAELVLARSLGKPVIPIKCGPDDPDELLRDTQWIDYYRDQEGAFAQLWQTLRQRSLLALPDWDHAREPYPGLNAFDAADAAVFFGRNEEIERLLACFRRGLDRASQAVALIGPSGSGKSSLVRAGLLPRLGRLSGTWTVLRPFTPQESMGVGLIPLLARHVAEAFDAPDRWEFLADLMMERPDGLLAGLRALVDQQGLTTRRLLITVDQLEELVTSDDISPADRLAFARTLRAGTVPGSPIWAVLTLRAEFLAPFLADPGLSGLTRNQILVSPLDSAKLREVIEGPAEVAEIRLERGLADEMIRDVPGTDALPLLAYCLQQLYIKAANREPAAFATVSDYRSLGSGSSRSGIEAVLVTCADDAVAALAARDESVIFRTLLRLVNLDGHDEPTKRLVRLADLNADETQVMAAFIQHRLLTSKRGTDGQTYVDVAHEALFRAWTPIAEAIEAQRSTLRLRSDVERLMHSWSEAGRDPSYCLGGARLRSAEQLIAAGHLVPGEDQLMIDFLQDSRRHDEAARTSFVDQMRQRIAARLAVDPQLATLLALGAAEEVGQRSETWFMLNTAVDASRLRSVLAGHSAPLLSVAFSPDGSRIATSSEDGTARVWFASTGAVERVIDQHRGLVGSVCFSPDGRVLLTASADGTACLWQLATGTLIRRLSGHDGRVRHADFSADGRLIVTSGEDGTARIWSTVDGRELARLAGHAPGALVLACAFAPDTNLLVSSSSDHTAILWEQVEASGWQVRCVLRGHEDWVRAPSFSHSGEWVATASEDGTARVWSTLDGALVATVVGHTGRVRATAWSPDDQLLLTASGDSTARLWETESWQEVIGLRGHPSRLRAAAFVGTGDTVATAGEDGTARVWAVDRPFPEKVLLTGHGRVRRAVWSPDGDLITVAGNDGHVQVWDARSLQQLAETQAHDGRASSAVASLDGRRVISCGWDGTVRSWQFGTEPEATVLARFGSEVRWLELSPSGASAAIALGDGPVRIIDTDSGAVLTVLTGHVGRVLECTYSGDGGRLVTSGEDRTVRLWDLATASEVLTLRGHEDWVRSACLSPDGTLVASGAEDSTVRLWDATSGVELRRLVGHEDWVRRVAFSPDGARIVSCSGDRTVRVWMVENGQCCHLLPGHDALVLSAEYDPSGTKIATASYDGTVRIWSDLPYESLVALARQRTFRPLTREERDAAGLT